MNGDLCGTAAGIRRHWRLEEPLCGLCAHHETVLSLEAERMRPTPPKPLPIPPQPRPVELRVVS